MTHREKWLLYFFFFFYLHTSLDQHLCFFHHWSLKCAFICVMRGLCTATLLKYPFTVLLWTDCSCWHSLITSCYDIPIYLRKCYSSAFLKCPTIKWAVNHSDAFFKAVFVPMFPLQKKKIWLQMQLQSLLLISHILFIFTISAWLHTEHDLEHRLCLSSGVAAHVGHTLTQFE